MQVADITCALHAHTRGLIYRESLGGVLRCSNVQIELLLPVIRRELLNDPDNVEWAVLLDRFIRYAQARRMFRFLDEFMEVVESE